MTKILVCGDSFMSTDHRYPGRHWTEMMPEYTIINLAQSGATNGMIAYQFITGVELHSPDAVVLGFTSSSRFEIPNEYPYTSWKYGDYKWTSNVWRHHDSVTEYGRKVIDDYQQAQVCELEFIKSALLIFGLLQMAKKNKLKISFSYGLYEKELNSSETSAHYNNLLIQQQKKYYSKYELPLNLINFGDPTHSCIFHMLDDNIQKTFATDVTAKINEF